MKIVIVYTTGPGLGHQSRAKFLERAAKRLGCDVSLYRLSLEESLSFKDFNRLYDTIKKVSPDWVILDLPWTIEGADFYRYCMCLPSRICSIEGGGRFNPDLWIGQKREGQYCAPDYLIINPSVAQYPIENYQSNNATNRWFVYGGGQDEFDLAETFCMQLGQTPAEIIIPSSKTMLSTPNQRIWIAKPSTDTIRIMRNCQYACVAAGITMWEAIALDIPTWVFAADDRTYCEVLPYARAGYFHLWFEAGRAPQQANLFEGFLNRPPRIVEPSLRPDGRGAERVIKLLK